ncbi:MAG TPA: hypothetical protein VFC19_33235 [Candidatus Limnocylindrales bacterium]|nr:hypothetical protein [Candidatus Limnocylindrales bacterium]
MGRSWLRRHAPVILVLAAVVWIIVVIVWITVSPVPGTGNPMD